MRNLLAFFFILLHYCSYGQLDKSKISDLKNLTEKYLHLISTSDIPTDFLEILELKSSKEMREFSFSSVQKTYYVNNPAKLKFTSEGYLIGENYLYNVYFENIEKQIIALDVLEQNEARVIEIARGVSIEDGILQKHDCHVGLTLRTGKILDPEIKKITGGEIPVNIEVLIVESKNNRVRKFYRIDKDKWIGEEDLISIFKPLVNNAPHIFSEKDIVNLKI